MDDLKYKYLKNAKTATSKTENLKVLNEGIRSSALAATKGQDYDPSTHGGSLFSWATHTLVSKARQNAIKNRYNKALNDFTTAVIQNNGANAQVELSSKLKQFTLHPDTNQKKPELSKTWIKHLVLDLFDILNKSKTQGITITPPVKKGGILSRIKNAFTPTQQNPSATVPLQPSVMYNSRLREYIETMNNSGILLEKRRYNDLSRPILSPEERAQRRTADTPQKQAQRRMSQQGVTPVSTSATETETPFNTSPGINTNVQQPEQQPQSITIDGNTIKNIINILVKHPIWKTVGGWTEPGVGVTGTSPGQVLKDLGFENISSSSDLFKKLDVNSNTKLKDAIDLANNQNDKEMSEQRKNQLNKLFNSIVDVFNKTDDSTIKEANDKFIVSLNELKNSMSDSSVLENIIDLNTKQIEQLGKYYQTYKNFNAGRQGRQIGIPALSQFRELEKMFSTGKDSSKFITNYNKEIIKKAQEQIASGNPALEWNKIVNGEQAVPMEAK